MKLKLALLAMAALVFGALSQWAAGQQSAPSYGPQAQALVLLPATLNGWSIREHWDNPWPSGAIEQGALYALAGLSADQAKVQGVQLDFNRNNSSTHNGIACYLVQGESLVWQRLQTVRFATAPTVVDLALLRTRDRLRLAAATECRSSGCSERPLPVLSQLWQGFNASLNAQPAASVVPVSIVLQADTDADHDLAATQAALLDRFERAAAQIDLAPAQRLAALQSGTSEQ